MAEIVSRYRAIRGHVHADMHGRADARTRGRADAQTRGNADARKHVLFPMCTQIHTHTQKLGYTPSTAGTFQKKFRKNSRKTLETLSERFLEFPSRVRLGSPKPYNSRHLRLPEHFQNSLPPQYGWGRFFFQKWFRRGPVRAGHGIPSSTEDISENTHTHKHTHAQTHTLTLILPHMHPCTYACSHPPTHTRTRLCTHPRASMRGLSHTHINCEEGRRLQHTYLELVGTAISQITKEDKIKPGNEAYSIAQVGEKPTHTL